MQYTSLGDSGIQISRIVHGCMELGGGAWDVRPDAENAALLHTALEHGVTAFDTAESYGGGHSEEVVGRTLAPLRDKVVLCTKVSKEHLHKKDVLAACEGSLRRLRTDYIDLYYIHWPNPDIEIGETMEAFELLKAQGKIRAIGVSNFSAAQMRAAQRYARLDALQPEYNLLCRGIEDETLAFCRENHIAVLTYNSIAKGILSGVFHFGGARVTDFRTAGPPSPTGIGCFLPQYPLLLHSTSSDTISTVFSMSKATPDIVVSKMALPNFPFLISYPPVTPNINSPVMSA